MPAPNDFPCFPVGVSITPIAGGQYTLSQALVDLLINARNGYDWPQRTGAANSQQTIINLMATVHAHLFPALTLNDAHAIAIAVSQWAGNNANSHQAICQATPAQKNQMQAAITCLITPGQECTGIDRLCTLPGISLVIASKIFRFCSPQHGAAVDRHASYFFNSLQVIGQGNVSQFARQWANGRHTTSRLAIYNQAGYMRNKAEYFTSYLPILSSIAQAMNAIPAQYTCMATNHQMNWTSADVEMAAYYWWALNGAR
jgi:hypothetical protein